MQNINMDEKHLIDKNEKDRLDSIVIKAQESLTKSHKLIILYIKDSNVMESFGVFVKEFNIWAPCVTNILREYNEESFENMEKSGDIAKSL